MKYIMLVSNDTNHVTKFVTHPSVSVEVTPSPTEKKAYEAVKSLVGKQKYNREPLGSYVNRRGAFCATVSRLGTRIGGKKQNRKLPTVCFQDITDEHGNLVADHSWLSMSRELASLALQPGDRISFVATVGTYVKGCKGTPGGSRRQCGATKAKYKVRLDLLAQEFSDDIENVAIVPSHIRGYKTSPEWHRKPHRFSGTVDYRFNHPVSARKAEEYLGVA